MDLLHEFCTYRHGQLHVSLFRYEMYLIRLIPATMGSVNFVVA